MASEWAVKEAARIVGGTLDGCRAIVRKTVMLDCAAEKVMGVLGLEVKP